MATGGGGGGAPAYHVAEAFCTLVWKDKAYYDGLKKAEKALFDFGVKANGLGKTLSFGGVTKKIDGVTFAVNRMADALATANRHAASLADNLRAIGRIGPVQAITRGQASANATLIRAQAAAQATLMRAALGGGRAGSGGGTTGFLGGAMAFPRQVYDAGRSFVGYARQAAHILNTPFRLLDAAAHRLLRVGHRIGQIGGLLGLGGGVGAGLGLYGAGSVASSQERTLATLRRITGASRGEMAALSGGINATAARTPGVGLGRFYEVAETGARMGIPTDQLRGFTEGMAKLGIVLDEEELPLKEAANRIGSLISVFGESADSAVRFGSALVKLDQMSTASARDIIDIANRFSGPAAAFGMKPQESLALATALRQARVPVETAGTSVGQILMRMASRRDMPAFAKLAGQRAGAFASMVENDPVAALKAVTQGLADMDRRMGAVATSRALDKLHLDGQRVRGTMIQLSRTIPLLDQYLATANDEWRNLSAIMEGQAVMGETFTAQWEATKTALKLVAIELGRALLPAMKGFAAGVRNLSGDIAAFVSRSGPAFEAFGSKVKTVLEGIGVLWRQWPDVLQYAGTTIAQTLAWVGGRFEEFGKQVGANLKWLVANIPAMLGNAIKAVGPQILPMLADLGKQMKDALATGEIPAGGLGKAALIGAAAVGTKPGRWLLGRGIGLAGKAAGMAMKLPGPAKALGALAAAGMAAPAAGRAIGGWVGRKMFGEAAPEWNPRLAGQPAPAPGAIPPAPGFNLAGVLGIPQFGAMGGAGDRIKAGILRNRARDKIANPPPWVGNAANIAANPIGAAAGLAGLGVARLQAVLPGLGQPTVGMLTPGTFAHRRAMLAKQAGYGPGGPGVNLATIARPLMGPPLPPRPEPFPALDVADGGIGGQGGGLVPGTRAWAAHMAARREVPRGADTRAGGVWEANRARRMGINAGFRQWRAGVNAMMRGQAPMMGDGRREVGADPNDPAKKLDKTNSILVDIKNALTGGAKAPANPNKGKGGAAVFG